MVQGHTLPRRVMCGAGKGTSHVKQPHGASGMGRAKSLAMCTRHSLIVARWQLMGLVVVQYNLLVAREAIDSEAICECRGCPGLEVTTEMLCMHRRNKDRGARGWGRPWARHTQDSNC